MDPLDEDSEVCYNDEFEGAEGSSSRGIDYSGRVLDSSGRGIDFDNPKETYLQLLRKVEKLQNEAERRNKVMDRRMRMTESKMGISTKSFTTPWRATPHSNSNKNIHKSFFESDKSDDNFKLSIEHTFKLVFDTYSIISAWEWNSKPFWMSLFVSFLQITLVSVLIVDLIGGAPIDNPLAVPGNVEYTVRIAQAVAVPIAVFKQEDLREGIEGLFQGMPNAFKGDSRFESMTPLKWRIGFILRFGQGFLSMFASFILLQQSETVFDLLLNFLGIEFISVSLHGTSHVNVTIALFIFANLSVLLSTVTGSR